MSTSDTSQGPRRRPRWLRRAVIVSVAVLALLAIASVTAPAWMSGAIARHVLASNLGSSVRGAVSVADVQLSWPGPQRITGLSIAGEKGDRLTVDLDVDAGLWGLVRGTAPLRVIASGSMVTRYSDDGTLSIMDALSAPDAVAAASAPASGTRAAATGADPLTMPDALRGAVLKIESFAMDAKPTGTGPRVSIDGLKGELAVTDGGAKCTLDATTKLGDTKGSVSVKASAGNLWNTVTGGIDPWRASVDLAVRGEALPIPAAGMPIEARTLELDIEAAEVGREMTIVGSTQLVLPGGAVGSASADLKFFPARADAKSAASASGTVQLRDVPMSLAAPYLADTPLDVARDLGTTCDATIAFADRSGQAELRTQRLEATATLAADEKMEKVSATGATLATTIDPALAKALGVETDEPVAVQLLVRSAQVDVPKLAAGDMRGIACDVGASLAPVRVRAGSEADAPWIPLGATTLSASVPDIAKGAQVELDTAAFGAPVRLSAALASLVDAKGAITAATASAKGTLSAGPVDPVSIPWFDDALRTQLAQAGIGSAQVSAQFDGSADAGSAVVKLDALAPQGAAAQAGPAVAQAASTIGWSAGAFTAKDTSIAATLTRATLAPWLGESIELAEDVALSATVEPLSLVRRAATKDAPTGIEWPSSVRVSATTPRLALRRAPSLLKPVALRDVTTKATVGIDTATGGLANIDANLSTAVIPSLATGAKEAATVKASYAGPADATQFRAALDVALAEGSALAPCIDAGAASALVQGPGTVRATLDRGSSGDAVTASVRIPRASADIDAVVAPGSVVMRPSTAAVELPTSLVEAALGLREAPDLEATLADARAPRIRTDIRVESIKWTGNAEDAAVVLSATLGAGTLAPPGRPPIAIDGIEISVASPKLASSAKVAVQGRAGVGGAPLAPFALGADMAGNLRAVMDPAQPLSLSQSSARVEVPGTLAVALTDWWRGSSVATDAVAEADRIALNVTIASASIPSRERLGDASIDATAELDRIRLVPKGKPAVAVGPVRIGIRSARLADRITVEANGAAAIADDSGSAAMRTTGEVNASLAAVGLVGVDGALTPQTAQLIGSVRVNGFPTVIADTFAGAKGDLVGAVGPAVTMEIDARSSATAEPVGAAAASAARVTEITVNLSSSMVQMQIPRATLSGGMLSVGPSQPAQGSIVISPALKDWVLEQINPVFSDIVSAPPVKWRVSSIEFPLDMNMARMSGALQVEVGDVRLKRSNQFVGSLIMSEGSADGSVPALIEPLRVDIAAGRVTYRDFRLNVGRFANDWQNKLIMSGDIDLTRKPPYVNRISFEVPFQSIARTAASFKQIAGAAEQLTKAIQALPIDPGTLLLVDITFSGPLAGPDGTPAKLTEDYSVRFDEEALKRVTVKDVVGTVKGIADLFRKKKETPPPQPK